MKKELTAQAGPDGLVTLNVPLGKNGANKTVHVVVETVEKGTFGQPVTQEEWIRFVHHMAGGITDASFKRQPQGDYEQREELP
jgi:hypothetical protein